MKKKRISFQKKNKFGILCKINPDQIQKEFPCVFSRRSEKNIFENSFKMNPDQKLKEILLYFFSRRSYQIIREFLYKIYEGFVLKSVKPTPMIVNIPLSVSILSAFKLTFRSTHSSLNLTTTPHYVLMSYLPPYLPTYLPTAKRFLNFSETWHT